MAPPLPASRNPGREEKTPTMMAPSTKSATATAIQRVRRKPRMSCLRPSHRVVVADRAGRAERRDLDFDGDCAAVLEDERQRDSRPRLQGCGKVHQHQMGA